MIEKISDERKDLYKVINEAKGKKAKALMNMGIITYQKIREENICNPSFKDLCDEILGLDKIIYEYSSRINNTNKVDEEKVCKCGAKIDEDDKFCFECGQKIELLEVERKLNCIYCEAEIDLDSNFCTCCGKRVLQEI